MKNETDFQLWLSRFESGIVNHTDEVQFDTYQIIKDVDRMKSGKFVNPHYPDGMEKLQYNLGRILHFTLYRFSDQDYRQFTLSEQTEEGLRNLSFFKAMLRGYLSDANYDSVMNKDREHLIDGHLMTKEIGNKSHRVRLLNIVRDWSNPNLEDTGLAEKTFPSLSKIQDLYEEMEEGEGKRQLGQLITESKITNDNICAYEWWTEDDFDGKEHNKGCIKLLDTRRYQPEDVKGEEPSNWMPFIVIDRFATPETRVTVDVDEIDFYKKKGLLEKDNRVPAYVYKEARLFEQDGHALGVGVWRVIQGLIERFNEEYNESNRHSKLAAKGLNIYTRNSRQRSITQEILNRIDTNAVLEIKSGEKFENFKMASVTAEHLQIADKIFELARQTLGISPSAVIQPLASQSATSAAYEQENAKSTYAIIAEVMNLYYQELFRDFKIPSIINHLSKQRTIKLLGNQEEIDDIEGQLSNNLINKSLKNSTYPFKSSTLNIDEEQKLKTAIKKVTQQRGTTRFLKALPKKLLDLFQYDIVFYSGSTAFDKREKKEVYNEMIAETIQNPRSRYSADKIHQAKLELFDVDHKRFEKSPDELQKEKIAMEAMIAEKQGANLPNTSINERVEQ